VLGVLLRAGPMFVGDWRVPTWLARATPGTLALSVGLTAASAAGAPSIVARAADMLAVATVAAVMLAAGALRRSPRALPMLSRSVPEARIFRVAVASSLAASRPAFSASRWPRRSPHRCSRSGRWPWGRTRRVLSPMRSVTWSPSAWLAPSSSP
jgi:hypothetical protein